MRKILIIGGSKGIGKAILESHVETSSIISFSRSENMLNHDNLISYTIDVTKDELPEIEAIDTLIYCPGTINLKPFNRIKLEDFQDEFDINYFGAIKCIQKYLPQLKQADHPSILMFSTVAVKLGMPFHSGIASAKGAVEGLVKSLAAEFAPKIRVNAIAPTLTDTELASKILRNEKMRDASIERHPLKKILNPSDVASLAGYLISNNANAISGQIIPLDSGIVNLKV